MAADGFRPCPVKHAVENGATDGDFGLLTRPRPGPKAPSYDGLVSPDDRFDQEEFSVAVGDLFPQAPSYEVRNTQ